MQSEEKNNIFKILLIGGEGAGKSTLFHQIVKNEFIPYYLSTIGIDIGKKEIDIENIKYQLIFIDTPGQDRFQSISQSYYKRADCCVIVYNLTNEYECKNVKSWINYFNQHSKEQCPIIIVGTHQDDYNYSKNYPSVDSFDNYQSFKVCLKYSIDVDKILQAIVNITILKKHEKIKTLNKITQNPVCQKFKNIINNDIDKIDGLLKIIDQSKNKMLDTFDKLIEDVQLWKNEMGNLKQNYQSQDFLQKIEQSNLSDELFIQQEQVTLNDQMRQVNQSYAQKSEISLTEIQNVMEEASKLKIEFKNNQPQI